MTWNEIVASQVEGKTFHAWSVSGKARNVDYTVDSLDEKGVAFRKQNGKLQKVNRSCAETVIENWERYKAGEVTRADLAIKNFSTSYLLGCSEVSKRSNPSEFSIPRAFLLSGRGW